MLLETSEINKRNDETDPPKLSSLSTNRKKVENDCSLENQTTMAEKRIIDKGKNKLSTHKEDSSSFYLMSGAARILEQPKELESLGSNYVKHITLASSTSPAVNVEVVETKSLPSTKQLESMSESSHERPKRFGTSNISCPSIQSDVNKPPKKRRAYYVIDDHEELINAAHSVHRVHAQACSASFWKKSQPIFAPLTPQDELLLKSEDVFHHNCSSGAEKSSVDEKYASSSKGGGIAEPSNVVPSIYSRVLSALIHEDEEDDIDNPNEGRSLTFDPTSVPSSSLSEADLRSLDDRMLEELHKIGLYPEREPHSEDNDEWIDRECKNLVEERRLKVQKKKEQLEKIEKAIQSGKDLEKRKTEEFALELLTVETYMKTMVDRRRKNSKGLGRKPSKQESSALIQRTLDRCREYEDTGRTCFSQPDLQQILFSAPPPEPENQIESPEFISAKV